jgi:hypothetical protein
MKNNLSAKQREELSKAIFACSSMKEWKTRETIVYNLPDDIKFNIIRHTDEYTDVYNIIAACYNSDNGMERLLYILSYFEGSSKNYRKVEKLWRDYSSPIEMVFGTLFLAGCLWALLVYIAVVIPSIYISPLGLFIYLIPTIVIMLAAIAIPVMAWLQSRKEKRDEMEEFIHELEESEEEEEEEEVPQAETAAGVNP